MARLRSYKTAELLQAWGISVLNPTVRVPTPTCFSRSPTDSSALDSSRYFALSPHPPRALPLPVPRCAPDPTDTDATLPSHPEPSRSPSQEPQQSAVYLSYMALEYNVSLPQAARE